MDFTGRSMRGMVMVDSAGIELEAELEVWVQRGLQFVTSLPPK